jgi:hypothetical protein
VRLFDKLFRPPSKNRFARLLSDAVRKAGETATIRYDVEGFRLVIDGPEKRLFNLANIYQEYCAQPPRKRKQTFGHYVRSWFANRKEIPVTFEDLGPDLLPNVRNRSDFEIIRLKAQVEGLTSFEWPHKVIAEHLAVGLVYDLPEAIMQVQERHLSAWGRSLDEALEIACENLREISQHQWESPCTGVWLSPWRDNHDASRLVLTDLLRSLSVKGGHVAMLPNRDTLLVTGSEDEVGLALMADRAEKTLNQARPISGLAFLLDDETWRPWLPDTEHPLHDRFHALQLRSVGQDYTEQKHLLDALHQKSGTDIWVASYSAIKNNETGKLHSYCVWSQGVDTLMPKTELVYFFVPKGDQEGSVVVRSSWDRVQQVVGHLMERQDIYPGRYRVKEFPTTEELALLEGDDRISRRSY